MKKIIWILTLTLIGGIAYSQDSGTSGSQTRLERKLAKESKLQLDKERLNQLAQEQNLVLEANALYGRHGYDATTIGPNNFILIDSNRFVLQTSSSTQVGQNGLGGVTIRGTITSYKVTPAEGKKPLTIIAQVSTFGMGGGTLTMKINNPENAQATFINNAGQVTFSGPVTSKEESSVYQGLRLY